MAMRREIGQRRRGSLLAAVALATAVVASFAAFAGAAARQPADLLVYSGGVNRAAIPATVAEFERREGVRVTIVYDGCGALADRMRDALSAIDGHGQPFPDAFIPCDRSYIDEFGSRFEPAVDLAETDLVIVTRIGNPRRIESLADLANTGLRVGIANPRLSAMGALTRRATARLGCDEAVMVNVRQQGAKADPLLDGVRAGRLDAAVVFAANASTCRGRVTVVPLSGDGLTAITSAAVSTTSPRRELARRLISALTSDASRDRYLAADFRWLAGR